MSISDCLIPLFTRSSLFRIALIKIVNQKKEGGYLILGIVLQKYERITFVKLYQIPSIKRSYRSFTYTKYYILYGEPVYLYFET